jgi:surface protein with Ig-like domain
VTPTQFHALVAAANASQSSGIESGGDDPSSSGEGVSSGTDASSTPPIIQINGDNPTIINVGDTYADLGATITGPQADLNLGIKTFLNGTLTSNIVIDTSTAATDTIDYVVTDQSGLAATSTRTVVISPAAQTDTATTTTQ